ncbi:hypothetical protein K470DRAFT_254008 [Piedraia hortae CBS 480.64]|uniref:Phosphatidylinositol N-acetylglucosaminyltransferase subunit H conserved domain-containing protein n=1 Tax=Piedraia hortae CBS 480.64 TaxID=1314780 RepID=A0A6A7CAP7_9PEZI|nr:hypothetical protein K470DRAFT_254008 [Piedraia hortae CBS 480.64]
MLSIARPTPTTVQYTVSTRSSSKTVTGGLILVRVLLALSLPVLLLPEFHEAFVPQHLQKYTAPTAALLDSHTTQIRRILAALTALFVIFRRFYIEESLLVIRGLGVQTTTSSASSWGVSTRFISTQSIQDIFIHEAFRKFEVRYYLCIVVDGETDAVVVFSDILPRREILEQVWRGARACLYEP